MPDLIKNKDNIISILFLTAFACIPFISNSFPFFGDGILNSKIATWYYENDFQKIVLPEQLDAGHPPLFPIYLASWWKIFGRTLFVSHMAMLPILLGIGYQILLLAKRYASGNFLGLILLFFLLEPTLLAHSTLISADLFAVFFFFLGINSIFKRNNLLLSIAMSGLLLITLRGMLMGFSIFIFHGLIYIIKKERISWKLLLPYIAGAIPFICWIFYHHAETGWFISTESSNWKADRQSVGILLMLKNFAAVVRNYLDFGRVFLVAALIFFTVQIWRRRKDLPITLKEVYLLGVIPVLVFTITFIPLSNPIGPRYFICSYLLISLLFLVTLNFLYSYSIRFNRRILYGALIFLISGHFWIYPDYISKGWDCSLSTIAYYKARNQMNDYIRQVGIPFDWIGADFPYYDERYTDLKPAETDFSSFDLRNRKYLIITNISHHSKEELEEVKGKWILVKKKGNWPAYVELYKKPSL